MHVFIYNYIIYLYKYIVCGSYVPFCYGFEYISIYIYIYIYIYMFIYCSDASLKSGPTVGSPLQSPACGAGCARTVVF